MLGYFLKLNILLTCEHEKQNCWWCKNGLLTKSCLYTLFFTFHYVWMTLLPISAQTENKRPKYLQVNVLIFHDSHMYTNNAHGQGT